MTRIRKYDQETVLFAKRVPKSSLKDVSAMVEKYLERFKVSREPNNSIPAFDKIFNSKVDKALGENHKAKKISPALKEKLKKLDPKIELPEIYEEPHISDKATVKDSFTVAIENIAPQYAKKHKYVVKEGKEVVIQYPCGCTKEENLFRRNDKCKLSIEKHKA
jgi:hypothetical protein